MVDQTPGMASGRVAGDVTVAELSRRLDRIDIDQRERFRAVDDRFTAAALSVVPRDVYEERHLALRGRVENLERAAQAALTYRRNMALAVIAALVTSAVNLIVNLLLARGH